MNDIMYSTAANFYMTDKKMLPQIEFEESVEDLNHQEHNALFEQYRSLIVNSLITAFGLDGILFNDINGGAVQTIHNAKNHIYAKEEYELRGEREYHRADYDLNKYKNYTEKKTNVDEYTGKDFIGDTNRDHIVSLKEIHDDVPMRVLFSKEELAEKANDERNIAYTSASINKSKGAKHPIKWANEKNSQNDAQTNAQVYNIDLKQIQKKDNIARSYLTNTRNIRVLQHYGTSVATESVRQGTSMGIRQGLGIIFTELTMIVMEEMPALFKDLKGNFNISAFLCKLSKIVKKAFGKIKAKFMDIMEAIKTGFVAGVFNSVVTTIINMFFTTTKNLVKLIRQCMISLTQAIKILFFDDKKSSFEVRAREATKVIFTGVSVVIGILVQESVNSMLLGTGIGAIPIIGETLVDVICIFSGTFVTGSLSLIFIYWMDNDSSFNALINFIKSLTENCFEKSLSAIKQINAHLDDYIANICAVDKNSLKLEINNLNTLRNAIESGDVLSIYHYCHLNNIELQFQSYDEFKSFMVDKNSILEI